MSDLLEAALNYAQKGWPVFPCRFDKRPYTDEGVLEATTNPKQIREWWTEDFPRANIGVDVGGAGMVAIDLDPGSDDEALAELLDHDLDTALIQRTPRGGEHLFFTLGQDEIVPPSASSLADKVDIRSHHSYTLVWPSRTAEGEYEWISNGKPAHRPQKLVEWAQQRHREKSKDRDTWIIEPDLEDNIADAVAYLRDKAQIAVEGHNGDTMAYKTAAMMKSYGISRETAFDLMWQHWNPRCEPPWTADEVEHLERKIENAYEYNTSPPGNLTRAYRVAHQTSLFQPVSRDTSSGGRDITAGRFRVVDERGVADITPPGWLVEPAIPERAYALLIGPRSTFKSFIALDMALSVASGGKGWFDDGSWDGPWPDIRGGGPVLYAAGEGRAGFRGRVQAWAGRYVEKEYTDNFFLADPVPYPEGDDLGAFLEAASACASEYALVILDTVGRAMQGLNENAQQDASLFTRMCQEIQYELGCAVLAIHHTGHGASDRARGSSVFEADADTVFVTERYSRNIVRLRMTKQKDAPEWEHAKLLKLVPFEDSLIVEPVNDREAEAAANKEAVDGTEPPSNSNRTSRGRKPKEEVAADLSVVRKVAYQILKAYPGKEWSKNQLSLAISADDRIVVAAGTIRNSYLEQLLTDKKHPVAQCFDIGKSCWVYKPKKGKA